MLEVIDCEQNSDEWIQARLGIPTASKFTEVQAKVGPRGGVPKGRQTYLRKLAGEVITGYPMDNYSNSYMDKGHERETEARELYGFLRGVEPIEVGFIRNGNCGCSPDALIGDDGMWENKNAEAHIQIERLENGVVPKEHIAQCQGQLMVAERAWLDFMSYSRGLPPLVVRIERDEAYISSLRESVDKFNDELSALVAKIRGM